MTTTVALLLASILVVIGLFHVLWAVGVYWPFATEEEVAQKVLSDAESVPPPPLTALIGVLLAGAAYLALAVHWTSLRFVPDWMYEWGIWAFVAVMVLRAVVDPLATRNGSPEYKRLNLRLYSPLCLLLAVLATVLAI